MLKEGGSDTAARLTWAWRQALPANPRADELQTAAALLEKHRAEYAKDPQAAAGAAEDRHRAGAAGPDPAELAAWTSVARVISESARNHHQVVDSPMSVGPRATTMISAALHLRRCVALFRSRSAHDSTRLSSDADTAAPDRVLASIRRRSAAQSVAQRLCRRSFLRPTAAGLGSVALGSLLPPRLPRRGGRPTAGTACSSRRIIPPKAKRVIWLTMAGGPSHLETFDHKPMLAKMHGQPMPESMTKGQQIAQLQGRSWSASARRRVQEVRPDRRGDLRAVPADRHGGRRDLHRPLDDHRGHQPRPGPHVHEHRLADRRPARHGRVVV